MSNDLVEARHGAPSRGTLPDTRRGKKAAATRAQIPSDSNPSTSHDKSPKRKRRKIDVNGGSSASINVKQEDVPAVNGSQGPLSTIEPRQASVATLSAQLRDRAQRMAEKEELEALRKQNRELRERAERMVEAQDLDDLRKQNEELEAVKTQLSGEVAFKDAVSACELNGSTDANAHAAQTIIKQTEAIEHVRQSLTCNICFELLREPHILAPCGHTACGNW